MATSAFEKYAALAWPYQFHGVLHVERICGGIPSDPNVAEAWIKSKLSSADDLLRQQVAEVMLERGITKEEASAEIRKNRHLNGFKQDPEHGLYVEGRQLKAGIKEAVSVAVAAGKIRQTGWGNTRKNLAAFVAEHVGVVEDRLYLGVSEPTGIQQHFPHTYKGTGIQYTEYVDDADIHFTVRTDWNFEPKDWALIWLTGEQQGLGAGRSMGYGRYTVTKWEPQH